MRREQGAPYGRVERSKHAGIRRHAGVCKPVEQRGLSCVGITDQGERGKGNGAALPAMDRARSTNQVQLPLDILDANGDAPLVRFQLRFARPLPGPDAAADPRHLDAMTRQARQHVGQPRQLNLQATLARPRPAGKDVQNELGTVEDLDA